MADKSKVKGDAHKRRVTDWLGACGYTVSERNKKLGSATIPYLVHDRKMKYTWVMASALAGHATDSLRKRVGKAVAIRRFDPTANIVLVVDYIPNTGVGKWLVLDLESLGVKLLTMK